MNSEDIFAKEEYYQEGRQPIQSILNPNSNAVADLRDILN